MVAQSSELKPKGIKETILAKYADGPHQLENALKGLSKSDLDLAPSKGGWSIREIIHHIADGDDIWKLCIKMALGNEEAEFHLDWYRAFPQTDWASSWAYADRSVNSSLEFLKVTRAHLLALLAQRPDGWDRSVKIDELDGKITKVSVGFVMEMQANHVFHHINRIMSIRQEHGV